MRQNPHCCKHLRGRGSVKAAIRTLHENIPQAQFAARFDIKSYYKSIRHDVLLKLLVDAGADKSSLTITQDYLRLPDTRSTGKGMVAGGSLSPLLGGLYLAHLDSVMQALVSQNKLVCYARFMDDVALLAKTRWHLKRAIAKLHSALKTLDLKLHPTKKFIGRVTHGFDFLGYHLRLGRKLRPSRESLHRLRIRASRLYEQEASKLRLRQYVIRWWKWLHGGLDGLVSRKGGYKRLTQHIMACLRI